MKITTSGYMQMLKIRVHRVGVNTDLKKKMERGGG